MNELEKYDSERRALREELHSLKGCQIQFLTVAVTATGVLLGLAVSVLKLRESPPRLEAYFALAFLLPLVVLLPAWSVFFDKARTITRIVGYYRVLEKLIYGLYDSEKMKALSFVGWENALGKFRKHEAEKPFILLPETVQNYRRGKVRDAIPVFHVKRLFPYWMICYYTFLVLSGLCLLASVVLVVICWLSGWTIVVAVTLAVVVTAIALWVWCTLRNGLIVYELIRGRHSYESNEFVWEQILFPRRAEEVPLAGPAT